MAKSASDHDWKYWTDDEWDEIIEAMESTPLEDGEDEETDIANFVRDNEKGLGHFDFPSGERLTLQLVYINKTWEMENSPCPMCMRGRLKKDWFSSKADLYLKCNSCKRGFAVDGDYLYYLDCDLGPDP